MKRQLVKATEGHVLDSIRLGLGLQSDLVLWRNAVVHAEYWDPKTAKVVHVHGGLPDGSSDLVGVGPAGRFFALEVKKPGEKPRPEQEAWLGVVRRFGGFGSWATSPEEAMAALERCRRGMAS